MLLLLLLLEGHLHLQALLLLLLHESQVLLQQELLLIWEEVAHRVGKACAHNGWQVWWQACREHVGIGCSRWLTHPPEQPQLGSHHRTSSCQGPRPCSSALL